jgi:hypothetical protein
MLTFLQFDYTIAPLIFQVRGRDFFICFLVPCGKNAENEEETKRQLSSVAHLPSSSVIFRKSPNISRAFPKENGTKKRIKRMKNNVSVRHYMG